MVSERRCQKLPPCQTEPMPGGSKLDLLLAKAEPISDCGSVPGITLLRKGENWWTTAARVRGE